MAHSKLMQRKIAWARKWGLVADEKLKVITIAQRAAFGGDDRELRRHLALARAVVQTDKAWTFVSIKDMRSGGNKRQRNTAYDRYARAEKEYRRFRGIERPEGDLWWNSTEATWADIDALVERLRSAQDVLSSERTTEEKT